MLRNRINHRQPTGAVQSGFTLIEVMVGVAIFAVLSALIVGSIQSDSDRNAKLEAERFIAVMNEVRDEALISGRTIILTMDEKSLNYGFTILGGENSQTNASDNLLRVRKVNPGVKLKWDVFEEFTEDDEGFGEQDEEKSDVDTVVLRVFVTPLGELTPFQARFGGEDDDFLVELNDQGILSMDIKPSNFFR